MLTLFLMQGLPASGKSTLSQEMSKQTGAIVISSDELRAVIGSGEEDQSKNELVFATAHYMTAYFLKRGQSVIIDACNVTRKSRAKFIEIAREHKAIINALVVKSNIEICLERNAARARQVPPKVILRMEMAWQELDSHEYDEKIEI